MSFGVGRSLARLLEEGVAEDLAHLLLGDRVLVVALVARLVRKEHDVDHLAQELAAPGRRGVPHAVELVHVLQRRDVVAEGDGAVADACEHLGRFFGRERAGGRTPVGGLACGVRGVRATPRRQRERKRTGPCYPTHPVPGLLREAAPRSLFWGARDCAW